MQSNLNHHTTHEIPFGHNIIFSFLMKRELKVNDITTRGKTSSTKLCNFHHLATHSATCMCTPMHVYFTHFIKNHRFYFLSSLNIMYDTNITYKGNPCVKTIDKFRKWLKIDEDRLDPKKMTLKILKDD